MGGLKMVVGDKDELEQLGVIKMSICGIFEVLILTKKEHKHKELSAAFAVKASQKKRGPVNCYMKSHCFRGLTFI